MFRHRRLALDKALVARIERHARELGYSSVEEFVTHVLERQIEGLERSDSEEAIKKRLRGLGYLG